MLGGMLLGLALGAAAQDGGSQLDRIEVTGSRITYEDLVGTPAISITRPGDYLLQELKLVNDSRDEAMRERELHETIAAMLAGAKGRYELLHGEAYRVQLDATNHRVEVEADAKRPDTSALTLYLRTAVGPEPAGAEARIRALRGFAQEAKRVGRTEIDLVGDTALGMNRPERYRHEVLAAIAQDAQRVTNTMQLDCKLSLDGLHGRLEWQRVSAGELMLYIPYELIIEECRTRGDGAG